jgi:uncharacterized protein (UPF0261 family)
VSARRILVIATLDTKGEETAYLCDRIRAHAAVPFLIDAGVLGDPQAVRPDISREAVASAAGDSIDEVRALGARGPAVVRMMDGLRALVPPLLEQHQVAGGVAIGGAEGALLGAAALAALPFGIPKLIVSPIVSGVRPCGPFVGHSDIALLHSVVDLQGLNRYTASILELAASMVTSPAAPQLDWDVGRRGLVGMSLNGNTTSVGTEIRRRLEAYGYEVISFHSNGVGGIVMEELAARGKLDALIDLTTNELVEELLGGMFPVRNRLRIAGRSSVPRVLVPGCLDFICQGPADKLDGRFNGRALDLHNPEITLVRVSDEEALMLAREFASRALESEGRTELVVPTDGLSLAGSPGGKFHDPVGAAAFTQELIDAVNGRLPLTLVQTHINDGGVADAVVSAFNGVMAPSAAAPVT